ncbi:hypothetical protein GOV06_03320 [Candidatus Woesearchaeota archaeon]|nr:hypothetical protein [Candidatus Woesearchaeota archaeon]
MSEDTKSMLEHYFVKYVVGLKTIEEMSGPDVWNSEISRNQVKKSKKEFTGAVKAILKGLEEGVVEVGGGVEKLQLEDVLRFSEDNDWFKTETLTGLYKVYNCATGENYK